MLDIDEQRPWAEDEIARAIGVPGDVRDSLRRLRASRLIHRWNDLATASRPAVRYREPTQAGDPDSAHDAATTKPSSKVCSCAAPTAANAPRNRFARRTARVNASAARDHRRAEPAGDSVLIERRAGRSIPSEVAQRLTN